MNSHSFIAEMNGLQNEFAYLPPEAAQLVKSLNELVEEQESLIQTMLNVNKKLLDKK